MENPSTVQPGDVVQINQKHALAGWVAAFVLVTEVRSWGIVGYVPHVATHQDQHQSFVRLKWEAVDRVGKAPLVPEGVLDDGTG